MLTRPAGLVPPAGSEKRSQRLYTHLLHDERRKGCIHAIKHFSFLIVIFALLVAGCANIPDRAPCTDPSLSTLLPLQASVDSNPEQNPVNPPEISVRPESVGVEGKDKPDYMQDQTVGKDDNLGDYTGTEEQVVTISDPLEPYNRAMYHVNDKLYFLVLKPVSQGYGNTVPEFARISVQNFFYNLRFPIRFVSCLLQAEFKSSAKELGRFTINTIWGIGGLLDPASEKKLNFPKNDVDLGQTLGVYGVGHGFYIVWPIVGSSSARDSVEFVGDYYLYPVSYIQPWYTWLGVRGYEVVNDTSLRIGDYESLKEAAIDPYEAIRDAYVQHRQKQLEKGGIKHEQSGPTGVQPEDAGGHQ
jgi:phospholipid-binding lipoprotein MlaA